MSKMNMLTFLVFRHILGFFCCCFCYYCWFWFHFFLNKILLKGLLLTEALQHVLASVPALHSKDTWKSIDPD